MTLSMQYKPHKYQEYTTDKIINNEACGALVDMGLGKTVSTLTAIDRLINEYLDISKVLVIAPKRVAEDTWSTEIEKWDHLRHLTISKVLGDERRRLEALRKKADIYIINRENIAWLVTHYGGSFPFDMVVIDELSSFKNPKSIRFRALRSVMPKVARKVGLTGTPTPNGLIDLWPQIYLLDQGQRLGKTITSYRDRYFRPGKRNGHIVYKYDIRDTTESEIYEKIGDICFSMKAEDYLDLPKRVDVVREITLPEAVLKKYEAFERDLILSLEDVDNISALNAASLTGKLLQFANGAVYDSEKNVHEIHTEKLEALSEEMEAANGKPVLVFYQYKHDLDRILKHFKAYKPEVLNGQKEIKKWNEGNIPMLLAHAASAGHGLNLQYGGHHIEWFGCPWSSELYLQAVARLDRQGQRFPVVNTRLVCKGTMDEDVIKSLSGKITQQDAVMSALKARIQKYRR